MDPGRKSWIQGLHRQARLSWGCPSRALPRKGSQIKGRKYSNQSYRRIHLSGEYEETILFPWRCYSVRYSRMFGQRNCRKNYSFTPDSMPLEIEAKFINIDPEVIRDKLWKLGFELVYPEFHVFRATVVLHDPNVTLRVRKEYGKTTMTYKYTDITQWALWTEEFEVEVSDFELTVDILRKTTQPIRVLYQESKRELWRNWDTEVSIDEWPWTWKYLEIEAPTEEELISTSKSLWFDYSEAIFGRPWMVYRKLWFDESIVTSQEYLTFENPPRK